MNIFIDFDKFAATADEWVEPKKKDYEDWGDLWQHMKQPDAFDQFAVTFDDGKMTQVYTNDRPECEFNSKYKKVRDRETLETQGDPAFER